jgi:hypothetical protein
VYARSIALLAGDSDSGADVDMYVSATYLYIGALEGFVKKNFPCEGFVLKKLNEK